MYPELLQLCGFTPEESLKEAPRIDQAFKIWGITREDEKRAAQRIKRFFDMELSGMGKVRGIWLKEFIDMTLAKEDGKKVIYSSFPSIAQITTAMAIMSDKIYSCVPEPIIMTVLGQYFDKLGPLLEGAEKSWLPPGQAHCAFLQARLTAILDGRLAKPDLLVSVGIACDQSGKTDDLIEHLLGIPVVHVDSCNDETGANWPHPDPRRVQYLSLELRNVARIFQQVVGSELTEEDIDRGLDAWSKLKTLVDRLSEIRSKADPMPMSEKDWQNIFELGSLSSGRAVREGLEALNTLIEEIKGRVDRGVGVLEKGVPRVLNPFANSCDPGITEVLEKAGLASVAKGPGARREKSLSAGYKSSWEKVAAKTLNNAMHASAALRIAELKKQCQNSNVDGLILAALAKCRSQAIYPRKAKEVIEKDLGIPVLALEFDNLDNREFTAEYYKSRIEPFAEMLKNKKKGAAKD